MIIKLMVIPRSSQSRVVPINQENKEYLVYLHSPPIDGKANEELKDLLSKHFKVPKSKILIKTGKNSRHKFIEILD